MLCFSHIDIYIDVIFDEVLILSGFNFLCVRKFCRGFSSVRKFCRGFSSVKKFYCRFSSVMKFCHAFQVSWTSAMLFKCQEILHRLFKCQEILPRPFKCQEILPRLFFCQRLFVCQEIKFPQGRDKKRLHINFKQWYSSLRVRSQDFSDLVLIFANSASFIFASLLNGDQLLKVEFAPRGANSFL